jgi:beta-glucosidase
LGYTSFVYKNIVLSDQTLRDPITISAEITNTGNQAGSELVQLYIRDLVGSITRPIRELKGFQSIELHPGETQQVTFSVTEEMLAFTRADGTKGIEPGHFHVWIAPDSASGLQAEFRV